MRKLSLIVLSAILAIAMSVSVFAVGEEESQPSESQISQAISETSEISQAPEDSEDPEDDRENSDVSSDVSSDSSSGNQSKNKSKHAEYNAYKNALQQYRKEAITAMQESNKLRAENARLLGEFRDSLDLLKESGVELSEETMSEIRQYMEQIRLCRDELKETKASIRNTIKENNQYRKQKDYAAMVNCYEEAAAIQEEQNELILQINTCISEMLKLLVAEA